MTMAMFTPSSPAEDGIPIMVDGLHEVCFFAAPKDKVLVKLEDGTEFWVKLADIVSFTK